MTSSALPVTLELAILATCVGLLIGIPLALLSASRPDGLRDARRPDRRPAALAMPSFLLGVDAADRTSPSAFHYNPNA